MNKKKRNNQTGIIIIIVALLAAAVGIRAVLRGGWHLPRFEMPSLPKQVRLPLRFTDYIESLPDSVYNVKKISNFPDSGIYYQILVDKTKPLVAVNLELTTKARDFGFGIKEAYEDTKKQWLRLLYSQEDTVWVRILIKRKQKQQDSASNRRPGICIVLYSWPPKDPKLAQIYLKLPEIGTLVVSQKSGGLSKTVLVALPLEPKGYPREDPGPDAILVDHSASQIRAKADKALNKYAGTAGFYAMFGSRALEDDRVCGELMKYCARKKLVFLEPQPSLGSLAAFLAQHEGVAYCKPDGFIGSKTSFNEAVRMLKKALQESRSDKVFVLLAPPNTIFLKALKETIGEKVRAQYDFLPITVAANEK